MKPTVLAIDPGSVRSAWLILEPDGRVRTFGLEPNDAVRELLYTAASGYHVVIEWIESYGMAVGREVFETVHWSGRFTEAAWESGLRVSQLPRRTVKLHLCGSVRAKDANIRQVLIDRYGGASSKGTKKNPGPLYGIANDVWSALAIAVTYADAWP